jgi:hypothetical protein
MENNNKADDAGKQRTADEEKANAPSPEMLSARDDMERVHIDLEDMTASRKSSAELREETLTQTGSANGSATSSSSDLTKEDYDSVSAQGERKEMKEAIKENEKKWPEDYTSDELNNK